MEDKVKEVTWEWEADHGKLLRQWNDLNFTLTWDLYFKIIFLSAVLRLHYRAARTQSEKPIYTKRNEQVGLGWQQWRC